MLEATPDVFNHNVETVPRLYARVRPEAAFERSLGVLSHAAFRGRVTKSGLMVGLGERPDEVRGVIARLAAAGVGILTIGQYLAPTGAHVPVERHVRPEEYEGYEGYALERGIGAVAARPFVRSSYRAGEVYARLAGSVECGGRKGVAG